MTIDEVAAEEKEKLVSDYEWIKQKKAEARNKEEELKTLRKTIRDLEESYRKSSVMRVLDFIRSAKITDEKELDFLLCHCQNKLNGNIDGTELNLKAKEYVKK